MKNLLIVNTAKSYGMRGFTNSIYKEIKDNTDFKVTSSKFFIDIILKIIFSNIVFFPATSVKNVFYIIFAKLLMKKIIVGIHDVVAHELKEDLKVKTYNYFIAKIATKIVTFSKFSQLEMKKIFRRESILYYFGVSNNFQFDLIFKKNKSVIYFGRFLSYQGVDVLNKVIQKLTDFDFYLLGQNIPSEFKEYSNVKSVIEHFNDDYLTNKLKICNIVLFPYSSATQSGGIPRAINSGCQCVGFDVGGLRDQAYPLDSFFVESQNINKLILAIKSSSERKISDSELTEWLQIKREYNKAFFYQINCI